MPKLNKRDKSKSALGKINQANAIIDNLKDSTIGSLIDSVNTLSTNYDLIYNDIQELIDDLSTLNSNYSSLSDSNISNTKQIQNINQ